MSEQAIHSGIGFTAIVGADGTPIVQVDFIALNTRFSLNLPADNAIDFANEFSQKLKEAAREAQRDAKGFVIASGVPHANGRP